MNKLNTTLVAPKKPTEEMLLDVLVQELFLSTLRHELEKQKESHADTLNEALFTLGTTQNKANKNMAAEFSTLRENLDGQLQEIDEVKEDARRYHQELIRSIKESRGDVSVLHESLILRLADSWQLNDEKHQVQTGLLQRLSEELDQLREDVVHLVAVQTERQHVTEQQHQALGDQLNQLQLNATAAARKTHRLLYAVLGILMPGMVVLVVSGLKSAGVFGG